MRKKILKEAKAGVIDIGDEISKAQAVELTTRERFPAQPNATDSSSTGSEYFGTKEELEKNADEG